VGENNISDKERGYGLPLTSPLFVGDKQSNF
jgi:hypothetical protein